MITNKELITKNPHRLFLQYLFPSVSATLFISLNFMVDTVCVGQMLGETGITALGIAQPATGILYGLGSLFGAGGSTLYSIHMGRGESKTARSIYTVCMVALTAITVLIMALGLLFLPQVTTFLGGTGAARRGVQDYLIYVFAFAPVFSLEICLNHFLRNDNAPRLAMASTFVGSGMNIALDVVFVVFMNGGIIGASLATSVSITVSVLFLIISTLRKSSNLRPAGIGPGMRCFLRIIRQGISSLVMDMSSSVTTWVFNLMLLALSGETAVAAYGIVANMTVIVYNALLGVSNAMQPLVSVNIGSGRYKRVRRILRYSLLYSLLIAVIFCVVGECYPSALIRVFVDGEDKLMSIAVSAVRITFLSYLLSSLNILLSTYFQAVDESSHAIIFSVLRSVVFPVCFVVGMGFALGADGIWFSALASEGAAAAVALLLFRSVQKKLRVRNFSRLKYFSGKKAHETLDEILDQLGADDLTGFYDLIQYCNSCDENRQSIPGYVCLEDFTTDYEGAYTPAEDDEDMGLFLAVGGLILTDLYEQNEEFLSDKMKEADYPAAAPAMNVLAEMCFRFVYDEAADETTVVPYRRGIEDTDFGTGEWLKEDE
ncbi:MAG: MATE family efflux transporter [Lachnospiraceae bacterium]|nr:MATE family efflux transporter [Lachnospiraceae bacterium]